ncbi:MULTISPECIES: peptidase domain-containing ABC transporter [Hydrotalea]|uniref:peptidase domain-containing ABC transporter n=1 Tax=Hydrotalea TaxID=1004300 RepID=UPI000A6E4121|nr:MULTISPECIES: peptidase domain-containing ABC transporter [Hydrotalea]
MKVRNYFHFPFQPQYDKMDCGPACLKMITQFYGKAYSLEYLRQECFLSREGVSLLSINDAAEKLGFRTLMVNLTLKNLTENSPLPCILHWNQDHFVVLYQIKRKLFNSSKLNFRIADPAYGLISIDKDTFFKSWISTVDEKGTSLLLEPTPEFLKKNEVKEKNKGYTFLFRYLKPYKKYIVQLLIGMFITSLISLTFPFLTQVLIDIGVTDKNLSILYLILLSQLFLFTGNTIIEIIRSWLLLHINARVTLNIISDFLIKLLKLPIKYFDTKAIGDISQRISDHHRIENFLTNSTLSTLFSIINIVIFSLVLSFYNIKILFVFIVFSILAITWIFLFQKKRKQLDYKRFARNKENQDKLFEMITGMQEIKLYGSETSKRWEWEQLQVKYFKLNIKSLALEQYQQSGFIFFSHLKNIIISYIAATEAIKGNMTIGVLLSISYIIGQTNSPLEQLVSFIKSAQDAHLSMDRLQEIHNKTDEENNKTNKFQQQITNILHQDIKLQDLSFQYEGPNSPFVLKDINLTIPKGKITAIVGTSGSGKTTLLKLLLNFYQPVKGNILIGNDNLQSLSPKFWRKQCGIVMQEGFIFYDTITKNIALDGKELDYNAMENAIRITNLQEFINELPLGYTTKIGSSGVILSGGQKQRILIARSVYKNPNYLFFDEATSNLDANNERQIMDNLNDFFKGKTVLIIAHRLSTVKNADQIIVLEKGKIVEVGNHEKLVRIKGKYFELVKNQLELGN